MKHSPPAQKSTSAKRKARVAAVVAKARAKGEKVPDGVGFIRFRELTPDEKAYGETLEPLARKVLSRSKAAA